MSLLLSVGVVKVFVSDIQTIEINLPNVTRVTIIVKDALIFGMGTIY